MIIAPSGIKYDWFFVIAKLKSKLIACLALVINN